nr:hypothetical protein [Desulfobacula sp.]
MKKYLILGFFILIQGLTPVSPALAHKVILFAWVEDGMIHTESSFAGERKARDCPLIVQDETGRWSTREKQMKRGSIPLKSPTRWKPA